MKGGSYNVAQELSGHAQHINCLTFDIAGQVRNISFKYLPYSLLFCPVVPVLRGRGRAGEGVGVRGGHQSRHQHRVPGQQIQVKGKYYNYLACK